MVKPTALLLDMDGVMAEVSRSYRGAIIQVSTKSIGWGVGGQRGWAGGEGYTIYIGKQTHTQFLSTFSPLPTANPTILHPDLQTLPQLRRRNK
jgi:hypothetical protein